MGDNILRDLLTTALTSHDDSRDNSRSEFVHTVLSGAILAGKLNGGERVREEEIAEVLGVSRTPVRDALRRLQSQGLLEPVSGRGLCVAALSRPQVLELYEMREVLEGAAARLAAKHATDDEIQQLRDLCDACSDVEDDFVRLAQVNRVLHLAIYDAAHNRYLIGALRGVYDSMALLGSTTFSVAGRSQTANDEHRAIIDAIARREPTAAEDAARFHIERAKETRLKMLTPR